MTGPIGTQIVRYTSDASAGTGDGTLKHTSDGRVWRPMQVGEQLATGETRGTQVGELMYERPLV